jgi:hypothetical protein
VHRVTATIDLRPIERVVLQLSDAGLDDQEIAWRFRRSPGFIRRVREMAVLPRAGGAGDGGNALRPVERRIVRHRDEGASHSEIAARVRRSPAWVERVERLARYKLER